jgi:hypothetical protein
MAYDMRTPRSRGSLCGLVLIVLGGWAGVAPFAGPSFGFGFTPDQAWHATDGRLYLSALPGAIVLLAGLIITLTRSRSFGGFCAFVAAVAGAWLIAGASLIRLLPASQVASITTGNPMGTSTSVRILTQMAFFTGAGALIVFFAALVLGRFSITALKDYGGPATETGEGVAGAGAGAAGYGALQAGQDTTTPYAGGQLHLSQYTSGQDPFQTGQYQAGTQYPPATEQYPPATEQYPPATENYPQATAQYPARDSTQGPFGLTQDWPASGLGSQRSFPPAPYPGYPGASGQTTPESTTAVERPPGQQDQHGPASPGS